MIELYWEDKIIQKKIISIIICILLTTSAVFPVIGIVNNNENVIKNQTSVKSEPQYDVISRDDEWPKFHHDLLNTGYSTSIAPQTNTVLWTYKTGFAIVSSPAVVNGKVYIGSDDEVFYCLDADNGSKLWDYPIPGGTSISSPAVYDGKVYVGTTYYNIFCWDADTGDLIWKYPKEYGGMSSPTVVDGKVYIGMRYGHIFCLNADNGTLIWKQKFNNVDVSSCPAVVNGRVYVGSYDGRLYCLDADNGSKLWDFYTDWMVFSSPAIADGKVYVGGGGLYCLDANTGKEFWCFNGRTLCSPAVAYGCVYFVGKDGKVYCVDAESGDELWNYTTSDDAHSVPSPAVADGRVYVGICSSGRLLCLEAYTGDKIWDYQISVPNWLHSSPAVAYGRVYIGGDMSCKVYCFEDPSKPPEKPSIRGPTSGQPGTEYEYKFVTTDPEENDVYYWIEWFEEDPSAKWEGPYPSGEEITRNHTWYEKGTYTIRVKAKDIYEIESHWATLTVTIPKNQQSATSQSVLSRLLQCLFRCFNGVSNIQRYVKTTGLR